MIHGALFNDDRSHRYLLCRYSEKQLKPTLWVMLNPSKADEKKLDQTTTKCLKLSSPGGMMVVNLFSSVATDPFNMDHDYYEHLENNWNIAALAMTMKQSFDNVVLAFGAHPAIKEYRDRVLKILRNFSDVPTVCLGLTKDGYPRHPLYVKNPKFQPFSIKRFIGEVL